MKTDFVNQTNYHKEIKQVLENLMDEYNISCPVEGKLLNEELYVTNKKTYHFVANLLKANSKDRVKRSVCSLIYKDVYRAEIMSAGAGVLAFKYACYFGQKLLNDPDVYLKNETELLQAWNVICLKLQAICQKSFKPLNTNSLKEVVEELCQENKPLAAACMEALNLAGLEGKIFVENSKQSHYTVELKNGYSFQLEPYKVFLDKGSWERKECKFLVADGFIESVSEIDQLLIASHKSKQPLVLVSQGFSEEVFSTLYTNYKNGALDVIPLRLQPNLDNLNVINDIGIVTGRDPVSTLKGDMLTFVKLEDLPTVEIVRVTQKVTNIENARTLNRVSAQIKALIEKREENSLIEDVQVLLENRIKNLSPNSVTLYLPEMSMVKNDSERIQIDTVLRAAKTLLNYGFISDEETFEAIRFDKTTGDYQGLNSDIVPIAENHLENLAFQVIADDMLDVFDEHTPLLSFYLSIMLAGKTILMILASAGFIKFIE